MSNQAKIQWVNDGFAPFFEKVQSHQVFDFCLDYVGCAEETILSSFAINEAFVRRLVRNRDKLGKLIIIWDTTMATRNAKILLFLNQNVDAIHLISNHSKTLYMRGRKEVMAVSSVNTTGNYRHEAGIITADHTLVKFYKTQLDEIISNTSRWTKL